MAVEIGSRVRQIVPVIEGKIVDTEYDKDAKCLRHLVEFEDAEGETHSRWFTESEIEEVGDDA